MNMEIQEFAMSIMLCVAWTAFVLVLAPITNDIKLIIGGLVVGSLFGLIMIVAFGKSRNSRRRR